MAVHNKINIIVDAGQRSCPNKENLRKIINEALRLEGTRNDISVNLLITDDEKIQKLNKQFLGRNAPTDVISFGSIVLSRPNKNVKGFIGEVVISAQTAEYNAKRFNTTTEKEIFLYIIHGILHLLGYGDKTKKEKAIIENRQTKILEEACGQLIS